MTHTTKQSGFTLIEVIMVMVILGVIAAMSSKMIAAGFNAALTSQNLNNANWQGRLAIERMVRDIRVVRSANDIVTRTASDFMFTDISGNSIEYKLSGGNLLRNTQILADGVNSLTFSYVDKNGNAVAGNTDVHYVGITLKITQDNANYSLTSSVYLRDLSS